MLLRCPHCASPEVASLADACLRELRRYLSIGGVRPMREPVRLPRTAACEARAIGSARPARSGEVQDDPLELAVHRRHLVGIASHVDPALPAIHAVAGGSDPLVRSYPRQFGDERFDQGLGAVYAGTARSTLDSYSGWTDERGPAPYRHERPGSHLSRYRGSDFMRRPPSARPERSSRPKSRNRSDGASPV